MRDTNFIRREQERLGIEETMEEAIGPSYDSRVKETLERQRRLERLRKVANM
jgi:hypothetical protein